MGHTAYLDPTTSASTLLPTYFRTHVNAADLKPPRRKTSHATCSPRHRENWRGYHSIHYPRGAPCVDAKCRLSCVQQRMGFIRFVQLPARTFGAPPFTLQSGTAIPAHLIWPPHGSPLACHHLLGMAALLLRVGFMGTLAGTYTLHNADMTAGWATALSHRHALSAEEGRQAIAPFLDSPSGARWAVTLHGRGLDIQAAFMRNRRRLLPPRVHHLPTTGGAATAPARSP